MAGRRSVWSDARVLERARAFVPAADEVWRLQRGLGPESRAFQRMADRGHYRDPGGSRQGIYVCTPAGELLASINALEPERVLATLDAGLAAWEALAPEERRRELERLPEDLEADPRWEWSHPADGLVLVVTSRDLPADGDPRSGPPNERANRDHAWFAADELPGLLPPAGAGPGSSFAVDPALVERLARFHAVDNVRGQTLPYAREEVAGSRLGGRVVQVAPDALELRYEGKLVAATDGTWRMGASDWTPERAWPRSITTHVLGRATWDPLARRFRSFQLVALGIRHGTTGLNGRPEGSSGPIGFAFELAEDVPAERVAPGFVDVYDAPWIRGLD